MNYHCALQENNSVYIPLYAGTHFASLKEYDAHSFLAILFLFTELSVLYSCWWLLDFVSLLDNIDDSNDNISD